MVAGAAVAGGVGEQVGDGLVQPVRVGAHGNRLGEVGVDAQAGGVQLRVLGGEGGAGDGGEVGVGRVQGQGG